MNSADFKTKALEAEYLKLYDTTLAQWPVPHKSHFVDTSFGKTHILVSGPDQAPPLVLLHGSGFSATMWHRNVENLCQQHRVYAIDIIGTAGKSSTPDIITRKEDCTDWLEEVLTNLNINKTVLMGHSFGAWLSAAYTFNHQDRVEKLILVSPAATLQPIVKQFFFRMIFMMLLPIRPVFQSFINWLGGKSPDEKTYDSPLSKQAMFGMMHFKTKMRVIPGVFSKEELAGLALPTLVVLGEREVIYDPKVALAKARELMPAVQTELIPETGHALPMERPEVLNQITETFLERA
jgi:pimeloyl-ACP methyl ester carboxylesterase